MALSVAMGKLGMWGTLDPFVESGGIMGRGVANAGFLRALLHEDPFAGYHFFLADASKAKALRGFVEEIRPALLDTPGRIWITTRPELPKALRSHEYACFHLSDCINYPAHLARLRNLHAPKLFPITAITHSLSYARYHKEFLAHLWPGCTPRDCVVATSETARTMLTDTYQYLREAYALKDSFTAPRVSVIPLGVESQDLRPIRGEQRRALRQARGVGEGEVALLVFARLSHAAKLDGLALLRALVRAATPPLSMRNFVLILAGAHDKREDSDYLAHLDSLATNLGLKLFVEKNPNETRKLELFSLCDIFVSPVDNYQETFGISLLEAGAMELPTVASDFDGYRSLIKDGETGILVPTTGAGDTLFLDAAANVLLDNQHQLLCAQQVAVEVPALAMALRKLALSPGLRARMGRAARQHVTGAYSWNKVIWRYVQLWQNLWDDPVSAQERERLRDVRHPMHVPLNTAFQSYPTQSLDDSLTLRWTRAGEAHYRGREGIILYGGMQSFLEPEWIKRLLFLARKGASVADLREDLAGQVGISPHLASWCVLWALKHDLLERES